MARCRSCGAEIVFQRTRAGKSMPCDPGLVPFWADIRAKEKVITEDGDVVSCRLEGEPEEITGVGRIPHWANCQGAGKQGKNG